MGPRGSMASAFAGASGRFPLMSVQVEPASVVRKTWPLPKLDTVRYALNGSFKSAVIDVTQRFGMPEPCCHGLLPPTDFQIKPSLEPTYTVALIGETPTAVS